jgi:transcriptional regulator with XRE-family HTH domain
MNERLFIAIKRSKLHQYEVAGRARISDTYLTRILYGRVDPSGKIKGRIARALNMRVDELFVGDSESMLENRARIEEDAVA